MKVNISAFHNCTGDYAWATFDGCCKAPWSLNDPSLGPECNGDVFGSPGEVVSCIDIYIYNESGRQLTFIH